MNEYQTQLQEIEISETMIVEYLYQTEFDEELYNSYQEYLQEQQQ